MGLAGHESELTVARESDRTDSPTINIMQGWKAALSVSVPNTIYDYFVYLYLNFIFPKSV